MLGATAIANRTVEGLRGVGTDWASIVPHLTDQTLHGQASAKGNLSCANIADTNRLTNEGFGRKESKNFCQGIARKKVMNVRERDIRFQMITVDKGSQCQSVRHDDTS